MKAFDAVYPRTSAVGERERVAVREHGTDLDGAGMHKVPFFKSSADTQNLLQNICRDQVDGGESERALLPAHVRDQSLLLTLCAPMFSVSDVGLNKCDVLKD